MQDSYAVNTRDSYRVGLERFQRFRRTYKLPEVWPPCLDHISLFLSLLSLEGLSYNTIVLYKNAIACKCKLLDKTDITQHYIVARLLEGIKKSNKKSDKRLPITPDILKSLLSQLHLVCLNKYETVLFKAAYTLAFLGFLRVGEITFTKPECGNTLALSDVYLDWQEGVLTIHLRHAKNDQYGNGSTLKIVKTSSEICAVTAMSQYLKCRPKRGGQLFCHFDGSPLTRYQFSAVLKKAWLCRVLIFQDLNRIPLG